MASDRERRGVLRGLARELRKLEGAGAAPSVVVPTGWPGADAVLARGGSGVGESGPHGDDGSDGAGRVPRRTGGLARPGVHEWFGTQGEARASSRGAWSPPLAILTHLAWGALESKRRVAGGLGDGVVLWIGARVWPYPRALVRDQVVRGLEAVGGAPRPGGGGPECAPDVLCAEALELARVPRGEMPAEASELLARSVFVDVNDRRQRLWAIDTALRCPSIVAVVADGSELDMAASRRLQLAAEAGRGLALLARPPQEARQLSAAATRWRVTRLALEERSPGRGAEPSLPGYARPSWRVELFRSKSVLNAARLLEQVRGRHSEEDPGAGGKGGGDDCVASSP